MNLTNFPSPELIAAIEDASVEAGVRVRVRVLFRYCGEPGTPGPYRVRVSTTGAFEDTAQVAAALSNAADRLAAADSDCVAAA